jgi:glycosyltransferase involved in cell wall biosynthesis
MAKKNVLIAVHQLNLGGVQKALISTLNAIDYSKNDVTLYIRKDRTDLLSQVNPGVSKILINDDKTRYYRKPYAVILQILLKLTGKVKFRDKLIGYIINLQMDYEKKHYFSDKEVYDIAISYIQSYTAKFVDENVGAKRKIMFYHGSTDEHHSINEIAMNNFEKVFCVSKHAMEAIKGFYPQFADKIYCLENYVDYKQIIAGADEFIPDYPKDKLILCSCGRITPVKGFDLAVEAADLLRQRGIDFKWYFVGDGSDRAKIDALIKSKRLEDFIEITGLQSNPYPYIKNCDIYVQPSYEEAQPLSVIEAHILCKPVVSTATAGGQSLINSGVTGLICNINPSAISDAIIYLVNNNELRAQITKNLSNIDYEADYKRFCRQWAELLGDK